MARALYSHAPVILLDDVLAALDIHTAKWIVEKALCGDLVKGRTIILVSHNIALAAPIASFVVLLGRNGTVSAIGSVSDVLKKDSFLRTQLEKAREEAREEEGDIDIKAEEAGKGEDDMTKQASGRLIIAEEKAIGRAELAAFMLYIKGIGSPLVWSIFIIALSAAMLVKVGQTWFVGYWSSQYESHSPTEVPVVEYYLPFLCPCRCVLKSNLQISRDLRIAKRLRRSLRLLVPSFMGVPFPPCIPYYTRPTPRKRILSYVPMVRYHTRGTHRYSMHTGHR